MSFHAAAHPSKLIMPNTPQIRNLNFIRQKDPKTAEAVDDLVRAHQNIGAQLASDPNGSPITPAVPGQIQIQQQNGFVDLVIIDNSPISRAINYFVEISTTPGFQNPRTVPNGPSRNYHTTLPNGTFYFRVRSQYPAGGPASAPSMAVSVTIASSVIGTLTLFASQGSGTGGGGAGQTITRK